MVQCDGVRQSEYFSHPHRVASSGSALAKQGMRMLAGCILTVILASPNIVLFSVTLPFRSIPPSEVGQIWASRDARLSVPVCGCVCRRAHVLFSCFRRHHARAHPSLLRSGKGKGTKHARDDRTADFSPIARKKEVRHHARTHARSWL